MTFVDLVTGDSCHKFFSVPTHFLSLGQKSHRKAKIDSRSFQNLNQQLQIRQTTELFDQLPIETKTTCHSLHVIYVISINFISLSPGKSAILLDPLNHVNPPIRRKMHHSKTSSEAPYTSAGRASVGLTVWTIEDRSPSADPQQT